MKKNIAFYRFITPVFLVLFIYVLHISFGYPPKFIYIVCALAFFLFIASINRKAYIAMIVFYTIWGVLYAPIGIKYGFPDVNSVGSFIYTNPQESLEFLSGISLSTYLFILFLLLCSIISTQLKINPDKKVRYWLFAFFFIPAFWSPVITTIKSGWSSEFSFIKSGLPEFRFFHDIIDSYNEVMKSNSYFAKVIHLPDDWKPELSTDKYDTYILVIGESVRKDFMQAYGFSHADNTPWMSQANGTFFSDFISASGSTQISLINSLTLKGKNNNNLNNSIITLARKAGFNTYWLSNQGQHGKYDSPVAMIGKQANYTVFLKEGSSDDRSYLSDRNLLPSIINVFNEKNDTNKKLIVIHLMGSHPQPCARTNNSYNKFIMSENISCYVQSISDTDSLLSDITHNADKSGLKWSMIYFSDHGLRISNNNTNNMNLIHADTFKQNFQVPLFLTSFDAEVRNIVDKRRSGLHMLPFLAQWMKISEPKLLQQCAWRENISCTDQSSYISFQNDVKLYDELPDDILDLKIKNDELK